MPNYYFNSENNHRGFYEIKGEKINIFEVLNSSNVLSLLNKLIATPIYNIKIEDEHTIIVFKDFTRLIIANIAFKTHQDEYDYFFTKFQELIKDVYEREALKKHFKKDSKPLINRKQNQQLKTLFIASSLSLSIILSSFIPKIANNKKIVKPTPNYTPKTTTSTIKPLEPSNSIAKSDLDILEIPEETLTKPEEEEPLLKEDNQIPPLKETNQVAIDLDFTPYVAENGRFDKYASTWAVCGKYIEYYCTRWGLPVNLITAQLTQESPNAKNGTIDNPCQLTYKYYENRHFKVPVYDESGFTGTYDEFDCTADYAKTLEGNIKAGLASIREYIDKYDSIITGIFSYNQGPYALPLACQYFKVNLEDYCGDENALKARDLIIAYYEQTSTHRHGDPKYLENLAKYLPSDERGTTICSGYVGSELIELAINSNLSYNNEPKR